MEGIAFSGVASGIKGTTPDMGLVFFEEPARVAALYTRNRVKAAHILYNRKRRGNPVRALLVNSGCANACTGREGVDDLERLAEALALELGIGKEEILFASTGVIGKRLEVERMIKAFPELKRGLGKENLESFARATMTTDTRPKEAAVKVEVGGRPVTIQADYLDYLDFGQKAIYRGMVELRTQDTILHSDRLEVLFADGARGENTEVTRAMASGEVRVTQPLRRASGERAEYDASRGEITLTGGQPTLEDAQRGFIQGQRLTFFVRDDTLRVDGGETEPTITQHRLMR